MSDETFSSPPPSLPMPMTSRGCGAPVSPSGVPYCVCKTCIKQACARCTHTSASAVIACITSFKPASPLRSRRISLTITCLRNLRTARVKPASESNESVAVAAPLLPPPPPGGGGGGGGCVAPPRGGGGGWGGGAGLLQQSLHFRAVARRGVISLQPIQQRRVCFQYMPGITAAALRLLQQAIEGRQV